MSKRTIHILIISIVFAATLVAVDKLFTPPVPKVAIDSATKPRIEVQIRHFCCTGCNDSAFQALSRFTWLAEPRPFKQDLPSVDSVKKGAAASKDESAGNNAYAGGLAAEVRVDQINQIDFMELNHAIRQAGLVPYEIKLIGIPQFELVANLPHVCCPACVVALESTFNPKKPEGGGPAPTILTGIEGAPRVSEVQKEVSATFRGQANISQFMNLLEGAGFAPSKIQVSLPK